MASQGFFLTRALLTTRFSQILQISGLKTKVTDKIKDLKIPDKPKRPLTAYFRFIQEQRYVVQKQHPEWKVTEVTKQLAVDWKGLEQTQKEKYENEYKAELEDYTKKYTEYNENLTDDQKKALAAKRSEVKHDKSKRKRRKKWKELNKPKQPMGAYMLYVTAEANRSGKGYKEMVTESKEKWAALAPEEKKKFVDASNAMRQEYDKELEEWEWKMIEEGNEDMVRKGTLDGKPAQGRKSTLPVKPVQGRKSTQSTEEPMDKKPKPKVE